MKIILSLLLILSICFLVPCQSSYAILCDSKEYTDETLSIATNILVDANYWHDFDDSREYITRAEAAACICMLAHVYDFQYATKAILYSDVPDIHWANPWVFQASCIVDSNGLKAMGGDGDGNFRPDEYITYQEFVKVLVTVSGWSSYVTNELDGYPNGFWKVSELLGINPFNKTKMADYITDDDAIILIYNFIQIPGLYSIWSTYRTYVITSPWIELWGRHIIRGYAKKIDDNLLMVDNKIYAMDLLSKSFIEGNVICLYEQNKDDKPIIISFYPVTALDFDNHQPISDVLLNWDKIIIAGE